MYIVNFCFLLCRPLVSKKFSDFTITYGLLNNPVFSTNRIQLDLEVRTYVATVYTCLLYVYG